MSITSDIERRIDSLSYPMVGGGVVRRGSTCGCGGVTTKQIVLEPSNKTLFQTCKVICLFLIAFLLEYQHGVIKCTIAAIQQTHPKMQRLISKESNPHDKT